MTRSRPAPGHPGRRLVGVLLALLVVACGSPAPTPAPLPSGIAPPVAPSGSTAPLAIAATADPAIAAGMPPASALDTRWGTYVSEREWGNPRESQGGNGWGMSVLEATKQDYRFAEDGIAAIADDQGEFHVGWALWDGKSVLVTERLFGLTNQQGANGETIIDRRTFGTNTRTHSYADYRMELPKPGTDIQQPGATPDPQPTWAIRLESARVDDAGMVMRATVTNRGGTQATLHVVLKGWFGPLKPGTVTASADGLLLHGSASSVAVSAAPATSFQASDAKRDLDRNLRAGGLSGATTGAIGALDYELTLEGGASGTLAFGLAESPGAAGAATGVARAAALRPAADDVLARRAQEAATSFAGRVTSHQDLYAAALSSLLWAQSYYAWDGSGLDDAWKGKVDAHDVLIMPDKWEYPWIASWDTAFHAVAASLVDPDLAATQLRFLFSDRWQQPDGHVPCAEWVMAVECPPLFAWSALRVAAAYDAAHRATDGDAFLAALYPRLVLQYRYWQRTNAVGGDLYAGGFLGMDNLPRGTGVDGRPAAQADGSAWMAAFARDLATIATRVGKPDDVTALMADRARVAAAVNAHLWDEETGFYYDADVNGLTGLLRTQSYTGLVPLIAGIVPPDRLPRVLEAIGDPYRFRSDHGLRSMSARSFTYVPGYAGRGVNSNWRGPIWMPYSFLVIEALKEVDPALAAEVADRTITMVDDNWKATGRIFEYFDGEKGVGLGADAQTGWTAVVANLIAEAYPAP